MFYLSNVIFNCARSFLYLRWRFLQGLFYLSRLALNLLEYLLKLFAFIFDWDSLLGEIFHRFFEFVRYLVSFLTRNLEKMNLFIVLSDLIHQILLSLVDFLYTILESLWLILNLAVYFYEFLSLLSFWLNLRQNCFLIQLDWLDLLCLFLPLSLKLDLFEPQTNILLLFFE